MENPQQPTPTAQPQNYNTGGYVPQQTEVSSVGDWMLTIFIMIIPLINIIMLFVWAFGGGPKVSKANWAKASLLWILIVFVLSIIISVLVGGAFLSKFISEF